VIRQILVACCVILASRPAWAQGQEKGWLDVNFGAASAAESEYSSGYSVSKFLETATFDATYSFPRGGSFDVGGGYMFAPRVGIGVTLGGTAHEDPAALAIRIPHPLAFNAHASDIDVTDGVLQRSEGSFHISAMIMAASSPRVRLRVFGGPSFFRAEQDVVSFIGYDQVFQIFGTGNAVDITTYDTKKSDGSGWGAHGGFDVSFFFNRIVGVGGLVRISRGSVDLDDYSGVSHVKVGGVQYGGGLRLRF
jgi:hypothetical protein